MIIGALAAGGVQISVDYDPPDAQEPYLAGLRNVTAI